MQEIQGKKEVMQQKHQQKLSPQDLQKQKQQQREAEKLQRQKNAKEVIAEIKALNSPYLSVEHGVASNVEGVFYFNDYQWLMCLRPDTSYLHIQTYGAKYGVLMTICKEMPNDFDIISKLLLKSNCFERISIKIQKMPSELEGSHMQFVQDLLQNNKNTLRILEFHRNVRNIVASDSLLKYELRYLEILLDSYLQSPNIKQFDLEYDYMILVEFDHKVKGGKKDFEDILLGIAPKIFEFMSHMIKNGNRDIELGEMAELLIAADMIRDKRAKEREEETELSYIYEIYKLCACREMISDGAKMFKANSKQSGIANVYRKEIICDMLKSCLSMPYFYPLDRGIFYGFNIFPLSDGLKMKSRARYKGSNEVAKQHYLEAFTRCKNVRKCLVNFDDMLHENDIDSWLKLLKGFVSNNFDSLRSLGSYEWPSEVNMALNFKQVFEIISGLPNLTKFNIGFHESLDKECGDILYNFVAKNKNLCILRGLENVNNFESEEMRQKIEAMLNERIVARFSAIE